MMRLVLASASPRRAELLRAAGFDFDVVPADVDERLRPGEAAEAYVARVAREKGAAIATRHPDRLVVAADTAVVVDGTILGKPLDAPDAARMLRLLAGRVHDVLTGVSAHCGERHEEGVEQSRVEFGTLSDAEIAWYVETGEPVDKAGAYAIQGQASRFCRVVDGPYDNVVGLPVGCVRRLLATVARCEAEATQRN